MDVGEAERVKVGAEGAGAETDTVVEPLVLPLVPVQFNVYVAVAVGLTVEVPEVACVPDHAPLAVHDVALVEDQVILEEEPDVIEIGEAERVTVGVGPASHAPEVTTATLLAGRAEDPALFTART